jgi:YYY domain-containing protein
MFWDWILREGWMLPTWWLLVTLAGIAAFPLCVQLLGGLPDKGYTLSRAVGMLLVAFVYWILASYGFVNNSTGGMILAWLIVLILALLAYFNLGEPIDWRKYWREHKNAIITAEILFIALFALWTIYRAYQNDTFTTEKPMEIMFISAIMRSEVFPPNDAWMAGFSISYYHFGYIMAAMLSMLSGVHSGFGFSMMGALLIGLTGLTLFGVGYNLARSRAYHNGELRINPPSQTPAIITAILTSVFVLLIGNFQLPLIEMPFRSQSAPVEYFEFWSVQNFTDMEQVDYTQQNNFLTITTPFDNPNSWSSGWWWWHTSRILTDYNVDGSLAGVQPIDEVPAFSFVLMDVHPHVLSLPFVALAIGLALNLMLIGRDPNRYETILYGLVVGGLLFLNTWDGPIYLVVMTGAEALRRLMNRDGRLYSEDWWRIVVFGGKLVFITVIAYLPFLIAFRSQAGGPVPNMITPTLFRHYFIMFGPVLLLSTAFLALEIWQGIRQQRMNWRLGLMTSGSIFLVLIIFFVVLIVLSLALPETRNFVNNLIQTNGGLEVVLPIIVQRRIEAIALPLLLLFGLAAIVARLFPLQHGKTGDDSETIQFSPATGFALLILAAAFGVTLVPEFVYLRDNFGLRINTIFKFYYQAWILFAVVSSYAVYAILFEKWASPVLRYTFAVMTTLILISGLAFPIFGTYSRAILEQQRLTRPPEQQEILTLDGRADGLSADYYAAVLCLGNLVDGDDVIVAEASQNTYNSAYGRVGAFTGLPTVINWENHERQWRGPGYADVAGTRRQDIDRLYTDLRWDMIIPIIDQYRIDYIMYAQTERAQYGAEGEEKFIEHLEPVCDFGSARVYAVGN